MKKEVKIFTDGASRGNPGPGGWGAIVVAEREVFELGGGEKNTTNNRMELEASIQALDFVSKKLKSKTSSTTIHTDSSYVLKGATIWIKGWQKNKWKTKQKQDVLNKDLWVKFLKVSKSLKLGWKLLPGHSGIAANERCDIIATSYAEGSGVSLYKGPLSGYGVDTMNLFQTKTKPKKSSGSKAKPYSYVSMVGGTVKTHATWVECEKRVKGVSGALFKKSYSKDDEQSLVKQWKSQSLF